MFPFLAVITLSAWDWLLMAVYFGWLISTGFIFSRRSKTSESYFVGNKKIPAWAIGFSLLAFSSVTFLAYPAAAYSLDWRLFVPHLCSPLVALLAMWLVIPFFRKASKTSAFEYLEARFGRGARLYGAIMFLFGQILKLGSVLYLLAIPLQMMTGIPSFWIVVIAGGFVVIYTIMGGIEAVIWTDVVQTVVLYLGGTAALYVILREIPGGVSNAMQIAIDAGKFGFGPMDWNLSDRTFWALFILGLLSSFYGYTADQTVVQRYLAAKDLRAARKATFISAVMGLPTWAFFFFIGTCLFAYYKALPDPSVVSLPADNVFPHFIMTKVPPGMAGLVLAGVLSAAMSTLSGSLNSFSTVATTDILKVYFFKNRSERFYGVMGRIMTGVGALLMFVSGFAFMYAEKESFLDLSKKIGGLLGGVIVCFFILGFFAPRVTKKVLWQSFSISLILNIYLTFAEWGWIPNHFRIHPYWVSDIVMGLMIALALILARIQRTKPENVDGLTVFTVDQSKESERESS